MYPSTIIVALVFVLLFVALYIDAKRRSEDYKRRVMRKPKGSCFNPFMYRVVKTKKGDKYFRLVNGHPINTLYDGTAQTIRWRKLNPSRHYQIIEQIKRSSEVEIIDRR